MAIKQLTVILFAASLLSAQSRETPVYLEQFGNLNASAERLRNELLAGKIDRDQLASLGSRIFALQKLLHRLQEAAGDVEVKTGTDKSLRLIQQGCMAIDYTLTAMTAFVDTGDRIFLNIAADGREMLAKVNNLLDLKSK